MKETTFIKQNKKKWARFEKLSGGKQSDPDEVARLFTEITEDLSYARTFYPRRSVRVYLNQLAQGVFTSLYKHEKKPLGSFSKFWKQTLPLELYRARVNLLVAFLFFGLAVVIGAVSQHYDPDFVRTILGDYYVESTERRIAEGNPMGVYGESSQTSMFLYITLNNIMVAFLAFISGMFLSLGTFVLLLSNGIMLGSFQWWFKAKGLLLTSFLAVWIHGAFEISAIVIAGGAGITLGNGILFPGSFTRMQSLIFAAKRGLLIMMSLIPIFIMAGFLESFVTRHYREMPDIVKWLIILVSFGLIILYYVIYPFIVARKYPDKIEVKEVPRYVPNRKIVWNKIRKVSEIFTDTFYLLMKKLSPLSQICTAVVLPITLGLLALIFSLEFYSFAFRLDMLEMWGRVFGTGNFAEFYKFFGWSLVFSLTLSAVYYVQNLDEDPENVLGGYFKFLLKKLVWMYCFAALMFGIVLFAPGPLLFVLIFTVPFLIMIPSLIVHENQNFFSAFGKSFMIGKGAYGDALGSFFIFILIALIFLCAFNNPIGGMGFDINTLITTIVEFFTTTVFDNYVVITNIAVMLSYLFYLFFMFAIYSMSLSFSYFSSNEAKTAKGLYERLEKFGKRNKTFETAEDYE
ncbi:MAG: stage II sporulation protein M [Crocinitomicaceae bacterium]